MNSTTPKLGLVIPVYNESGNIGSLVSDFIKTKKDKNAPYELVLVNNGSADNSAQELEEATAGVPWIKIVTIKVNDGYGGGIHAGLKSLSPEVTHTGWIPADLQYSIEDLHTVWQHAVEDPEALHKGMRTNRLDGKESQFVSNIYTKLVRGILRLPVTDINGLPKIFPRALYEKIDFKLAKSFVFDSQIMLAADIQGIRIVEHPVTFFARRAGVSSWSGKRWRVYIGTLFQLVVVKLQSRSWFQKTINTNRKNPSRHEDPPNRMTG